jgi:hypothetical protein
METMEPLQPRRAAHPQSGKRAHYHGGRAEENDEESAGNEKLERGQNEAQENPDPPDHARILAKILRHGERALAP